MNTIKLCIFCFVYMVCVTAAVAAETKVLLLDSTLIEHSENLRIVVGRVEKSPANPLFGEEHPWEARYDNLYPNVIFDPQDGLFKCWYSPFIVTVEDWETSTSERMRWLYRQSGLCYATSSDGIDWEKPKLELHPFRGSPSNILLRDVHGVGVFRDDAERDPAKRFKLLCRREKFGRFAAVAVAFSQDGIQWGELKDLENVELNADTHNNAFWAPSLRRYVAITRDWDFANSGEIKSVRLAARSESSDFVHWTDPQIALRGEHDYLQIYAMPVFYYGGIYIGLPAIFNTREDRVHVELAWSKDTVNWHKVEPGTPFIANSEKLGSYDWGCIFAAASPVVTSTEIKIYYSGSDGVHTGQRRAYLALATLRADGFAAATQADPAKEATIVTAPLSLAREMQFAVTADVETGGSIRISLLDSKGREIARSLPLTGSFSSRRIEWQNALVGDLEGVRLMFELSRARLYSYERIQK